MVLQSMFITGVSNRIKRTVVALVTRVITAYRNAMS